MKVAECFVCEKQRHCEFHHVVPKRADGHAGPTAPLCESCHDAVDRLPFDKWNPSEAVTGVMRAWAGLDTDGRLFLLKMFSIVCHAQKLRDEAA